MTFEFVHPDGNKPARIELGFKVTKSNSSFDLEYNMYIEKWSRTGWVYGRQFFKGVNRGVFVYGVAHAQECQSKHVGNFEAGF